MGELNKGIDADKPVPAQSRNASELKGVPARPLASHGGP